ncbi:MAG: FtsX-like permease family protein, partial [Halothiobacillaceae bacterium]
MCDKPTGALDSATGIVVLETLEKVNRELGTLAVLITHKDAIDFMVDVQFNQAAREDLALTFTDPTSSRVLHELAALPGVTHVEGFRDVPAILRFQNHQYRSAVYGIQPEGALLLAGAIGFGVVYNSATIALSECSRELASLRVLVFTRGEIAYILLGELAVLTLAAIPVGMLLGVGLVGILVLAFTNDLYRLPCISSETFGTPLPRKEGH